MRWGTLYGHYSSILSWARDVRKVQIEVGRSSKLRSCKARNIRQKVSRSHHSFSLDMKFSKSEQVTSSLVQVISQLKRGSNSPRNETIGRSHARVYILNIIWRYHLNGTRFHSLSECVLMFRTIFEEVFCGHN